MKNKTNERRNRMSLGFWNVRTKNEERKELRTKELTSEKRKPGDPTDVDDFGALASTGYRLRRSWLIQPTAWTRTATGQRR